MLKHLRPYQAEALNKLRQRLKEVTHPLLVNASVGAGKSLILSELLLDMERANYRALCLTMNSTLILQNAEIYRFQGGNPGVYCASLNQKDTKQHVIFASPHSIVTNLPEINFNLIIIDECHNLHFEDKNSMYIRILNHYGYRAQLTNYSFRIVGLTGTPYRGKGISIVGEDQFFKEEICKISTSWLIKEGYLVKPKFGLTHVDAIDFSQCRVQNTGKFKHEDIEKAIHKDERLTGKIMREVSDIVESRCVQNGLGGAFIFSSTTKHCHECAKSLPDDQWAIITGKTKHEERKIILSKATSGNLRYLISVNCLNVGVDIPNFDVCAWLRPTESLILYTQGIGRVLRLHPSKSDALVLDYAGNLERHGDIDDPIINEALQPTEETEKDYVILCHTCNTFNTEHARRCIGIINEKRCDHYFEFKDCPKCETKNDTTSRYCRCCEYELIDPNAKLKRINNVFTTSVKTATYNIHGQSIFIHYITEDGLFSESYSINSERSRNILYAKFVRLHLEKPSQYYMGLKYGNVIEKMLKDESLRTPTELVCEGNVIKKKIFR
jgi:DNA repair protein RadD